MRTQMPECQHLMHFSCDSRAMCEPGPSRILLLCVRMRGVCVMRAQFHSFSDEMLRGFQRYNDM